jgi:2-dehydropantoate 2-reductase
MIPAVAPFVLSLPDMLFFRVASTMVKIDPQARSSMLDDLERHRVTEIDYLNGEVVRLGEAHGIPTPVNRKVIALVREAEGKRGGSPGISASRLASLVAC